MRERPDWTYSATGEKPPPKDFLTLPRMIGGTIVLMAVSVITSNGCQMWKDYQRYGSGTADPSHAKTPLHPKGDADTE